MAYLLACANGNLTDAATWALCDGVTDREDSSVNISTTVTNSGTSTLSAATYDGVAVKIVTRAASPTGTMTLTLRNTTTSTDVASVTVNVSDIDRSSSGVNGWFFVKFGSTVTANGTDNYCIRTQTSSSTQVTLYSSTASLTNISRLYRRTTTQAPATSDTLIITGEWTAAATKTDRSVTMNQTVSVTAATTPSTITNDATTGTTAWTNPSNAGSSNNVYATMGTAGTSQYLRALNTGSLITAGNHVVGVKVDIERKASNNTSGNRIVDTLLRYVNNLTIATTANLANTTTWWPTTDTVQSYGGPCETFGQIITAANANGANNGIALQVTATGTTTASVDSIQITYYHTIAYGGVHISKGGTLTFGTNAATNYFLAIQGYLAHASQRRGIDVYSGGTLNVGTSGTRIPSDSTATIMFLNITTQDFGIEVREGGVFNAYGDTGRLPYTRITSTQSANANTLTVASTSGWAAGDLLICAGNRRSSTQAELVTIASVDSATQVTLNQWLANQRDSTSLDSNDLSAHIGNCTRNVIITGLGGGYSNAKVIGAINSYINANTTGVITLDYVEISSVGGTTTGKRGIESPTTAATSFSITNSVILTGSASSLNGIYYQTNASNTISDNIVVMCGSSQTGILSTTTGTPIITDNLTISITSSGTLYYIDNVALTFTGNIASGGGSGIYMLGSGSTIGTISNCICYNQQSYGVEVRHPTIGTVSDFLIFRCATSGLAFTNTNVPSLNRMIFDTFSIYGNSVAGVSFNPSSKVTINNFTIKAEASFSQSSGLDSTNLGGMGGPIVNNSTIGNATNVHSIADISIASTHTSIMQLECNNCLFSSTATFSTNNYLPFESWVSSQKHNQTAGDHRTWTRYGTLRTDTAIYSTASPSLRMTPNNATFKLTSIGSQSGFLVPAQNGQTITASVKVRKSVVGDGTAYNGNQPRLMQRMNYAIGVTTDTVIATATNAANGAFETISGATSALTDDGVASFYVDCDGTTGWVNVDDFSASVS